MRDMNSSRSASPSEPPMSPVGSIGDHMRIAACCNQGGRKYMEDRINIHCEFNENGQVDYLFVGIYDGHGGADASNFANQHLLQTIVKQPGFNSLLDSEVLEAIRAGFIETHNAMRKVVDTWPRTASGFTSTSGTTASVAFIRRGKLYIGHVGDSGIVLGSQKPTGEFVGTSLTAEHKPDTPEEKKRIEGIGGEVMNKSGVMRVVWVRPLRGHQGPVRRSTPKEKIPFLAVARALGDLWSYNSDMDAFVVSPEPDVSVLQLDSSHRCLIFGSDGLWNVLRPQNAVDIVNSHEWKEDEMSWIVNQNEGYETNHARWLGRHALMRWGNLRADNISVVTIVFGNRGVIDSSYAKRVERDGLSIEDILTTEPTSIIKVAPNRVTAVPTKPVELVFYGVSEAVHVERHPLFSGNHLTSPQNDYHRIPGYTNHERGPMFGSLFSSGQSSSFSPMNRSALHGPTPYRQYSQPANVFSVVGSSQPIVGKENGTSSQSSPATVSVSSRMTTTTVRVTAMGNMEEESDAEDESMRSATPTSNLEMEIEAMKSKGSPDGNQENGRVSDGGGNLLKCNTTPCKSHGVISCCACTLTRAPLALWSVSGDSPSRPHEQEQEFSSVTPSKETPAEPAASLSARRHTTNNGSPGLNLIDAYKCRRLGKQRRSCPNPSTPHNYNTRQSCRTTRAGTKLSPQKSLSTKFAHATPSSESYHKQTRQFTTSSRRRATVPESAHPPTSLRSRRRRTSIIRQDVDPESTPRRRTLSSARATKARKTSKVNDGMRLRSAKTPIVEPKKDLVTFLENWKEIEAEKMADNGCSLSQEGIETEEVHVDANVDTLGEQFLESLNLETPNVTSIKQNRGGSARFHRQIEMMAETKGYLHLRSSGSKSRINYKSMMTRKSPQEDRRRSAVMVSLKRKLYFDDHALLEQRSTTTTSSTLTKRIKNFSLLMKRST